MQLTFIFVMYSIQLFYHSLKLCLKQIFISIYKQYFPSILHTLNFIRSPE